MKRALRHPFRTLLAVGFVLRASLRSAWHEPRNDLADLVGVLRSCPTSMLSLDLDLVEGVTERLLPLLPPWGMGPCVKRSLMLLDLWSRAGLTPCFHLGFLQGEGARYGHAWVSAAAPARRTKDPGAFETWSA